MGLDIFVEFPQLGGDKNKRCLKRSRFFLPNSSLSLQQALSNPLSVNAMIDFAGTLKYEHLFDLGIF